jgi:hypothetical protein
MHHRFAREPRLAPLHQRDIGRGTAHVEGDDVVDAGEARRDLGADHAGAWPRQDRAHRQPRRGVEADHAAVRLRQMRRRGHPERCESVNDATDVKRHDRAEIGVDHRGRQALVLAELGRDFVRGADKGVGKFLGDDAAGRRFVRGIKKAVEKADRDGFDAGGA